MYHKPLCDPFWFGGERCRQVGTGAFVRVMLVRIKTNPHAECLSNWGHGLPYTSVRYPTGQKQKGRIQNINADAPYASYLQSLGYHKKKRTFKWNHTLKKTKKLLHNMQYRPYCFLLPRTWVCPSIDVEYCTRQSTSPHWNLPARWQTLFLAIPQQNTATKAHEHPLPAHSVPQPR